MCRVRKISFLLLIILLQIQDETVIAQVNYVSDTITKLKVEICGQVLDEKKEPLLSAAVQVYKQNELKGGAIADYDGMFSIKSLDTGSYNLLVTFTGYDSLMITRLMVKEGITKQNVVMSPSKGQRIICTISICCPQLIDRDNPTKTVWRRYDIENMPMR